MSSSKEALMILRFCNKPLNSTFGMNFKLDDNPDSFALGVIVHSPWFAPESAYFLLPSA